MRRENVRAGGGRKKVAKTDSETIVLSLIIVTVVLVAFWDSTVKSQIWTLFGGNASDVTRFPSQKDISVYERALNNSDADGCSRIGNRTLQSRCLRKVAITLTDPTICDRIRYSRMGKDDCFRSIAEKSKNSSLCRRIYNATKFDDCMKTQNVGFN